MLRASWCSDRTVVPCRPSLWQVLGIAGLAAVLLFVPLFPLFASAANADPADPAGLNPGPPNPASQTPSGRIPEPMSPSGPPLAVGREVPTTTMRCVFGVAEDRNTCLAGVHRKRRTFSIYVRSVDDPHLSRFVQQLDRRLAGRADDRAYVVVIGPSQFDEGAKRELREWARRLELRQTDVAVSVADARRDFGFFPETKAIVVFADQKQVRERHAFGQDDWNAESVERLLAACVRRLP